MQGGSFEIQIPLREDRFTEEIINRASEKGIVLTLRDGHVWARVPRGTELEHEGLLQFLCDLK